MQRFKEYLTEARARQMLFKARLKGQQSSFLYNLTEIAGKELILFHPKWTEDISVDRFAHHVTDHSHFPNLLKMQGTANSISVTLGYQGEAFETHGNVHVLVEGKINHIGDRQDIWSQIDYTSGARLIPLKELIVDDRKAMAKLSPRFDRLMDVIQRNYVGVIESDLQIEDTLKKVDEFINLTIQLPRVAGSVMREHQALNKSWHNLRMYYIEMIKYDLEKIRDHIKEKRSMMAIRSRQSFFKTIDEIVKDENSRHNFHYLQTHKFENPEATKIVNEMFKIHRELMKRYSKRRDIQPEDSKEIQAVMDEYTDKCRKIVRYLVRRHLSKNPRQYQYTESVLSHIRVRAVAIMSLNPEKLHETELATVERCKRLRIPHQVFQAPAKKVVVADFLDKYNKDDPSTEPLPI